MAELFSGDLATAFQILVLGWGGIFVVMLIIYLVSMALSKMFRPKGALKAIPFVYVRYSI